MGDTDFLSKNSRKTMKKNRTKQLNLQKLLGEDITLEIKMDRLSLMSLAKTLALTSAMGILPFEVCVFCTEIVEAIEEKIQGDLGFNDRYSQMNPEEFWAEFFPYPEGVSQDEHKQQILETFKKHRADWRKLWTQA
jgi:hypothetical protein